MEQWQLDISNLLSKSITTFDGIGLPDPIIDRAIELLDKASIPYQSSNLTKPWQTDLIRHPLQLHGEFAEILLASHLLQVNYIDNIRFDGCDSRIIQVTHNTDFIGDQELYQAKMKHCSQPSISTPINSKVSVFQKDFDKDVNLCILFDADGQLPQVVYGLRADFWNDLWLHNESRTPYKSIDSYSGEEVYTRYAAIPLRKIRDSGGTVELLHESIVQLGIELLIIKNNKK